MEDHHRLMALSTREPLHTDYTTASSTDSSLYQCDQCVASFHDYTLYTVHVIGAHTVELAYEEGSPAPKHHLSELTKPTKSHLPKLTQLTQLCLPYGCERCGAMFSKDHQLISHSQSPSECHLLSTFQMNPSSRLPSMLQPNHVCPGLRGLPGPADGDTDSKPLKCDHCSVLLWSPSDIAIHGKCQAKPDIDTAESLSLANGDLLSRAPPSASRFNEVDAPISRVDQVTECVYTMPDNGPSMDEHGSNVLVPRRTHTGDNLPLEADHEKAVFMESLSLHVVSPTPDTHLLNSSVLAGKVAISEAAAARKAPVIVATPSSLPEPSPVTALYSCAICNESFDQVLSLRLHNLRVHSKRTSWDCKACVKTFKKPMGLFLHNRKAHFNGDRIEAANLSTHTEAAIENGVLVKKGLPSIELSAAGVCLEGKETMPMSEAVSVVKAFTQEETLDTEGRHALEERQKVTKNLGDLLSLETGSNTTKSLSNVKVAPLLEDTCVAAEKSSELVTVTENTPITGQTRVTIEHSMTGDTLTAEELLTEKEHDCVNEDAEMGENTSVPGTTSNTPSNAPYISVNLVETRHCEIAVTGKHLPSKENSHKCGHCSKAFLSPLDLSLHVLLAHPSPTEVKACPCLSCGRAFSQKRELAAHRRVHHIQKVYRCEHCCEMFRRPSLLRRHLNTHIVPKNCYRCHRCAMTFRTLTELSDHKRIHIGEKLFQCDFCNRAFTGLGNLVAHLAIHESDYPHKCKFCRSMFSKPHELTAHVQCFHRTPIVLLSKLSTGASNFTVAQHDSESTDDAELSSIGAFSDNKAGLKAALLTLDDTGPHVKVPTSLANSALLMPEFPVVSKSGPPHARSSRILYSKSEMKDSKSGINKYESTLLNLKNKICNECGKGFKKQRDLRIHKRIHDGEKPYECNLCGKQFSQLGNLNRHKSTHTDLKPYKCEDCGASFRQASHLATHNDAHAGIRPYVCDLCGAAFGRPSHLKQHVQVHTGKKPFACSLCGSTFTNSSNYGVHMRIHAGEKPYKCKLCGKAFVQSSGLTGHFRIHTGEKPYKCDLCDACFSLPGNLRRHKLTAHSNDKPYACTICGKCFARSSYRTVHMRVHLKREAGNVA